MRSRHPCIGRVTRRELFADEREPERGEAVPRSSQEAGFGGNGNRKVVGHQTRAKNVENFVRNIRKFKIQVNVIFATTASVCVQIGGLWEERDVGPNPPKS